MVTVDLVARFSSGMQVNIFYKSQRAMKFFALIILLFLVGSATAQQYTGFVMDSLNNAALPYVNIGIVGKNIGTVSDTSGRFSIMLDSLYSGDTLRFSLIGYKRKDFLISEFRKFKLTEQAKIRLTSQVIVLNEVVIASSSKTQMVLGNQPKSKLVNAGFIYNKLGHEIGAVFRNNSGELAIDSVRLNFVKCNYDRIYLRLNVYKVTGDKIDNILKKPIYISLNRNEALKNPTFSMTEYGVVVDSDFLVSVELVKDLGEKGLYFYAKINDDTSPGIYRETSQSNWIYMKSKGKPVGISILAFVH